jgi:hypothetical protein
MRLHLMGSLLFIFYSAFCFACLRSVSCLHCCPCLWIVHYWLPLRFSLIVYFLLRFFDFVGLRSVSCVHYRWLLYIFSKFICIYNYFRGHQRHKLKSSLKPFYYTFILGSQPVDLSPNLYTTPFCKWRYHETCTVWRWNIRNLPLLI